MVWLSSSMVQSRCPLQSHHVILDMTFGHPCFTHKQIRNKLILCFGNSNHSEMLSQPYAVSKMLFMTVYSATAYVIAHT